ncbi:MAG: hypothetical protein GY866_43355 [Proteobacteria bacterium]|nr:hypothetical protein [Pseudomonadota bacterium]
MIGELGIDEAGRGSILGPLVMAGVVIPEDHSDRLKNWGITDSKRFGSGQKGKRLRKELADKISRSFPCEIIVLSSQEVDDYVTHKSLNVLEQETALKIIRKLPAEKVILDGENLFGPITGGKVSAYNKADLAYTSVAAASILAKSERDRQFDRICRSYTKDFGEIRGGGYANQSTLTFVNWYLKVKGTLPPFFRRSYRWKALDAN